MYITTYTPPFPSYAWMDKYSSSIVPHHISWPTLISLKYFERGRRFQDRGWGVCLVRVGVGAGSQKGWDGLDGGGEITNFAERETELLWKCLGKQVRASFHLLPALCPTLLSPLLWKADQRERRREMFWKSNLILEQSFDMRLHHPDWTSQLDVAFSQFHLLFPRGRELLILWWNREGCAVHSFLEEQSGLTNRPFCQREQLGCKAQTRVFVHHHCRYHHC